MEKVVVVSESKTYQIRAKIASTLIILTGLIRILLGKLMNLKK